MARFRNPYSTEGQSQSTVLADIAKAEAALAAAPAFSGKDRERRELEINLSFLRRQLASVIKAERSRLKAQGRFIVGLASRLPVGLDEDELALGAILGVVGGSAAGSPFSRALTDGIF